MTDAPVADLVFVDPNEINTTYRCCLWAAPGEGKTVTAASAPAPIMVVSADRPTAYMFARKHYQGKDIRETRYRDANTLDAVYRHLQSPAGRDIRTLVLDPIGNIIDQLVETAPLRADGDIDYQRVNKKILGFVKALRALDVNVVIVAHEKLNDGKKGDGKMYPAIGGPSLINKMLAEMDIVAHIERRPPIEDGAEPRWVGQMQPRGNLVCKDGTGVLGEVRIADLTRWFAVASEELKPSAVDAVPWDDGYEPAAPTTSDAGLAGSEVTPEVRAEIVAHPEPEPGDGDPALDAAREAAAAARAAAETAVTS